MARHPGARQSVSEPLPNTGNILIIFNTLPVIFGW
jgi:hypothetical protein